MGKRDKREKSQRNQRRISEEYDNDPLPSSAFNVHNGSDEEVDEEPTEGGEVDGYRLRSIDNEYSKFYLYQKSVQLPKGDISYIQKFFLMYVGGRIPLHLQEDFCGTALLSAEWIRTDPRRTAVGLDLDVEALNWCLENNLTNIGSSSDCYSRLSLFHGDVLHPQEALLVVADLQLQKKTPQEEQSIGADMVLPLLPTKMENHKLPPRDVICAFNYSCCCLHTRSNMVVYFKHVLSALSKDGGIFIMDIYGGPSSERKLQLKNRYPNFTYTWEQEEVNIVNRKTKISIHFQLKNKQTLRHAFSYSWRLWSLPEINDCLVEAGFQSVHFWIREMPDTNGMVALKDFRARRDVKYMECSSFTQIDAWNAYIVGVAKCEV